MARVYISVGSNIDPAPNIRSAVAELRRAYPELQLSPVYESEAVGFEGANFYNFVAAFDSDEPVEAVAARLRRIEDDHARDRSGPRFSSRTIDLDLLLYDDLVDPRLNLPRDEITRNAFVLRPLADIAPALRHPVLGERFDTLWQRFDKSRQALWPIDFEWQ